MDNSRRDRFGIWPGTYQLYRHDVGIALSGTNQSRWRNTVEYGMPSSPRSKSVKSACCLSAPRNFTGTFCTMRSSVVSSVDAASFFLANAWYWTTSSAI